MTKILFLIILIQLLFIYYLNRKEHFVDATSTTLNINEDISSTKAASSSINNNPNNINIDEDSQTTTTSSVKSDPNLPNINDDKPSRLSITSTLPITTSTLPITTSTLPITTSTESVTSTTSTNNTTPTPQSFSSLYTDDYDETKETTITPQQIKKFQDKIIDLDKLEKNTKDIQKINYTDYLNYHKDWIVPPSRPYVCAPPQKYPNTPFVEYKLSNGTPLSYLDETTVGYILPKFVYKEYK